MNPSQNKQLPEQLDVGALLTNDIYRIPMYQRNYAWEEGEITQLIQDVVDYQKDHQGQNYYIGTLVVFKCPDGAYETIDGQQRLTTLTLLAAWLKNNMGAVKNFTWPGQPNLAFENRKNSHETLAAIFMCTNGEDPAQTLASDSINEAMLNGYRIIGQVLPRLVKEDARQSFANYLLQNVQIMRVEVPSDTDLNHYFEIMNSRGEQLEKHEVLKAKLLSVLDNGIDDPTEKPQSKACLNLIWEACANMERYVQAGFSPEQRTAVFGSTWDKLDTSNFDELRKKLYPDQGTEAATDSSCRSLSKIISAPLSSAEKNKDKNEDAPQRFNSVINFPNFLLQVLRIYLNNLRGSNLADTSKTTIEVPLDDKRLISSFEQHFLNQDESNVERIKEFAFALLRCKYLYDHYIIKREFIREKDGWSLKRYKQSDSKPSYVNTFGEDEDSNGKNRQVLMLLAAFHVSTPTQAYKHWLSGALNWLYRQSKLIEATPYLHALESLANAFMRDRFLDSIGKTEYSEIIFLNLGESKAASANGNTWESCLSYGFIENNFVFNYLDYLLWRQEKDSDKKIADFEFTFRSSVEHFYPQHPISSSPWNDGQLNSFGNLCLISHAKNSRLSNYMPKAKKEHYALGAIDSVKQYLMMAAMGKKDEWTEDTMLGHQAHMIAMLKTALNGSTDSGNQPDSAEASSQSC